MYLEDDEKTSFYKLIISLNHACAAIFSVSGKVFKFIIRLLAGEANQNSRNKEVNS